MLERLHSLSLAYSIGVTRNLNLKAFFVARFARIYPLYGFALVLSAIYSAAWGLNAFSAYGPGELIADAARQALMVNALPIIGSGAHWIDPMWSLSIEAFCYVAIFPILFAITIPIEPLNAKWRLAIIMMLSGFAFAFYVLFYNAGVNSHRIPAATGPWIHWVGVVRGTLMFVCGWLAYTLYTNAPAIRNGAAEMTDLITLAIALILVGNLFSVVNIALIIVIAPLFILGISSGKSMTSTILSGKIPHYLGQISYSLYILHWPVMVFYWKFGEGIHPKGVRVAAIFITSLALASLSNAYLEIPLRRLLRKILG